MIFMASLLLLPTELLIEIFASMADDYKYYHHLAAYSLVCHRLLGVARLFIWEKARIYGFNRKPVDVLVWFRLNKHLTVYCRTIILFGNKGITRSDRLRLDSLFRLLPNIQTLVFAYCDLDNRQVMPLLKYVNRVAFNYCLVTPVQLSRLLTCASLRVKSMVLTEVGCKTTANEYTHEAPPVDKSHLSSLTSLVLVGPSSIAHIPDATILHVFRYVNARMYPALTSLKISVGLTEFSALQSVLNTLGDTLYRLEWNLPRSMSSCF